jgi:hypothetical protein
MDFYCYVEVFLLLRTFCVFCFIVLFCALFVCVCNVLLPPAVNQIAVNSYIRLHLFTNSLFNQAIITSDRSLTPLIYEGGAEYEAELPSIHERSSGFQIFTKLKLRH